MCKDATPSSRPPYFGSAVFSSYPRNKPTPPPPSYREYCLQDKAAAVLVAKNAISLSNIASRDRMISRLNACSTDAWLCVNTHTMIVKVFKNACKVRWCPICQAAKSYRVTQAVVPWVKKTPNLKFMTFTLKSSDRSLSEQVTELYRAFMRLRRIKEVKPKLRGGVFFFQVTYNSKLEQWHPHLHVVADADYIPQCYLSGMWHRITGDSDVVDIRTIHQADKVGQYVARYASVPCLLSKLRTNQQVELVEAFHKRRTMSKFGKCTDLQLSSPKFNRDDYAKCGSWSVIRNLFLQGDSGAVLLFECWASGMPLPYIPCYRDVDDFLDGIDDAVQAYCRQGSFW